MAKKTSVKTERSIHGGLKGRSPQDRLALRLFDKLWDAYRDRVPYVGMYEKVIADAGGDFVNDHIAFRTIASQQPTRGIVTLSRIFEALGYQAAGCYAFPDKHLSSIHYQHPHAEFPKLFISELRTWELEPAVRKILLKALGSHRPPIFDSILAEIASLREDPNDDRLLTKLLTVFQRLPWEMPLKSDVERVNQASQFGAWVMLHGYAVNHFTALVNSHGVKSLSDIDKTVAACQAAGIPMKSEIEGAPGSKLRQTATEACTVAVRVRDRGKVVRMPWSYAYFEIAERGRVRDPATGKDVRFEGFLGPQATQLFEMTRIGGKK
ncbi:DUF1338 domain-containing protein [bacterium]|nr:DUF1338 domain-containing protein [bacterium]